MTRAFTVVVVLCAFTTALLAVDSDKAVYVGGTISALKAKSEGTFSTESPTAAAFQVKKTPDLTIPYASITGLEYGQKAGRRVAVAVFISPLALFSKKRNHYLTITYMDSTGTEQAAVFELGKDIVRTTLKVLEVRSKKAIEYQDDEARKSVGGGQTP
jgi:hypothetical protein